MTRGELSQIYWLNRELKMWQEKKRECEYKAYPSGINNENEGMRGSVTSDKTGNIAAEIADITQIIDGILARIQYQMRKVYKHIDTIEDSQLRQIVQYRCVDCMNWVQVGHSVGITADAARMIFNRAYPKK